MHLTATKTRKIREQLDGRRRELLLRYRSMLERTDEEIDDRSPELIDTANDQWDVRVMNHMSDSDATALAKVVAALRRLDGGTYGICSECKQAISPGRLSALPEADRCAACAADAEHH
jgi:RNA polymerase-binding transcription factor DksA